MPDATTGTRERQPSIRTILNAPPSDFDAQRLRQALSNMRAPVIVNSETQRFYEFSVTYNGFHCRHETYDDMFEADGRRDEIWCEANLKVVDPAGKLVQEVNRRTLRVYGTVYTFTPPAKIQHNPQRESWRDRVIVVGQNANPSLAEQINALPNGYGSGNDRFGGITAGDGVPNRSAPWRNLDVFGRQVMLPDQLPMLMFRKTGKVDDKSDDALVITPHIYEYDGGSGFAGFAKQTSDAINKYLPEVAKAAGLASGNPIIWGVVTAAQVSSALVDLFTAIFGKPGDRPIGMVDNQGTKTYDPSSVVVTLTPETMRVIASNEWGLGPGIFPFQRTDNGYQLDGDYEGFLQFHYSEFSQP